MKSTILLGLLSNGTVAIVELGDWRVVAVFVLQLCGDEMSDELMKQGKLLLVRPISFGKIERIYSNLLFGNIIMFRKWLFHFYSCRQPATECGK